MARKNPRKMDRYCRPIAKHDQISPIGQFLIKLGADQEEYEANLNTMLRMQGDHISRLENRIAVLENIATFERLRNERRYADERSRLRPEAVDEIFGNPEAWDRG
jgi:hypothetical protein